MTYKSEIVAIDERFRSSIVKAGKMLDDEHAHEIHAVYNQLFAWARNQYH